MKTKVIAIGLDAAPPALLNTWIQQGYLKNLAKLRKEGTYVPLKNLSYYKAETPWTTFLTGCLPHTTGYWAPIKLKDGTHNVERVQAYDFDEYPPFYALGPEYKVAAFDLPQSKLSKDVNGLQVLAWGAHSPQTPSHSEPPELYDEINQQHGHHPALHRDHGSWWDEGYLKYLYKSLQKGLELRVNVCQDLLQKDDWDLFLTIFGEPHSAGHDFWYLSQPDHPLYQYRNQDLLGTDDPMRDVFEAADQALGKILADVSEDTHVVVFSAHGSGNNTTDVSSMLFLPELLYRFSFPGKAMLSAGQSGASVGPILRSSPHKNWSNDIWDRRAGVNPVKRLLRSILPHKLHRYIDTVLPSQPSELASPSELKAQGIPYYWQPTMWFRPFWSNMKAFALPSFSEGYIRINLQGREPNGIVSPEEYDSLCDTLIAELQQLTNPRTNRKIVKKVHKTRELGINDATRLPDADLVVEWDEEPADVVDHPKFGRIGPVPYRRTGSHRADGFMVVRGPDIDRDVTLPEGQSVDLAPTILNLVGAPVPEYFDGKPLVQVKATA